MKMFHIYNTNVDILTEETIKDVRLAINYLPNPLIPRLWVDMRALMGQEEYKVYFPASHRMNYYHARNNLINGDSPSSWNKTKPEILVTKNPSHSYPLRCYTNLSVSDHLMAGYKLTNKGDRKSMPLLEGALMEKPYVFPLG